MCLTSVGPQLVAKKNIICYKVVEFKKEGQKFIKTDKGFEAVSTYGMYSLIKGFKYSLGKIYKARVTPSILKKGDKGFHSFMYKKDANKEKGYSSTFKVVKCIIPVGTIYYEGRVNGDKKGYISNSILIQSIYK